MEKPITAQWKLTICFALMTAVSYAPGQFEDVPPSAWNLKILMFTKCGGFVHQSTPYAKDMFADFAVQYGFELTVTEDSNDFTEQYLGQYDVILLNNTNRLQEILNPAQKDALIWYVEEFEGTGRTGITQGGVFGWHGTMDMGGGGWTWFQDWLGGVFDGHTAGYETLVKEKKADPYHTAFIGVPDQFAIREEFYEWNNPPEVAEGNAPLIWIDNRLNKRICSWQAGSLKARSIFSSIGHYQRHFSNKIIRNHFLGCLLYASGYDGTGPPVNLSYSQGIQVSYTPGFAIIPNLLSRSGSAATSITVSPALPTGLQINAATGNISGTPTEISSAADYKVTVTNAHGSDSITINIEVAVTTLSGLTYSQGISLIYEIHQPIQVNALSYAGSPATDISISPPLPAGLIFNTSTGVMSGAPSSLSAAADYTVTVTNGAGSETIVLSIEVMAVPISKLEYSQGTTVSYLINHPVTPNELSHSGTAATGITISPSLPTGLVFNTGNGTISGTPTEATPAANYVVTVTNQAGSDMLTLSIEVVEDIVGVGFMSNIPMPNSFDLVLGNHNPFQEKTSVLFAVPPVKGRGEKSWVVIQVYDLTGEKIKALVDGYVYPGYWTVMFNGRTDTGRHLSSGIYMLKMASPGFSKVIRFFMNR